MNLVGRKQCFSPSTTAIISPMFIFIIISAIVNLNLRSVYICASDLPCPADLKTLSSSGVRRGSIPFKRPFLTLLDLEATSDGEKLGSPWKALAEASKVNNKEVRNILVYEEDESFEKPKILNVHCQKFR
jgi:hypothetical protein